MVDECLVPYEEESPERLRQKLAPVYHRNGAIYASRREVISVQRTILGKTLRGYVMPRSRSVNIDDELDLIFAGFLLDRNTP
jgi:CMP-N,N'-diacetyllegionaminic acid synthase